MVNMQQIEAFTPSSKDMEALVLASVVASNTMPLAIKERVNEDWFTDNLHKTIWRCCEKIYKAQGEIDEFLLLSELSALEKLDSLQGDPAEIAMRFSAGGSMHAHYIKECKKKYNHRQIIRNLRSALEVTTQPSLTYEEVISCIQPNLDRLFEYSIAEEEKSDVEILEEFIERKKNEADGIIETIPNEFRVFTGIPGMEELFGPIDARSKDNLIVLGAPSSLGKSATMRQILNENLKLHPDWTQVAFLLESDKEDFWHQCACSEARVDTRRPTNKFTEEQKRDYFEHLEYIKSLTNSTLFLFDRDSDMKNVKARCREIEAKNGKINCAYLDYLQIVSRSRKSSPEAEVAEISRETKSLQKYLGCPVFTGTQLNEEGKVRESRAIFNDATRVWIIDRPNKTPNGTIQDETAITTEYFQTIHQQKYRNGRKAKAGIKFEVTTQRISDWT